MPPSGKKILAFKLIRKYTKSVIFSLSQGRYYINYFISLFYLILISLPILLFKHPVTCSWPVIYSYSLRLSWIMLTWTFVYKGIVSHIYFISGRSKHETMVQNIYHTFFFLPCQWHVKIPGEVSSPHHSSDLSCCNDNARSLTCCITREFLSHFPMCSPKGQTQGWTAQATQINIFQLYPPHSLHQTLCYELIAQRFPAFQLCLLVNSTLSWVSFNCIIHKFLIQNFLL